MLDDDASRSIIIPSAPFDDTYRPQGSLAEFNGENPNGTWTLRVTDTSSADDGTLYKAGGDAPWGTAIGTQLLLRNPLVKIARGIGSGNGGAINLEATHGDISVGNIRSLSETADGGRIDLNANKDVITGLINYSSERGNGGDVNLNAISGEISTFSLDTSSFDGDGGSVEMKALGDITTSGNIETQSLDSRSNSRSGNSGNGGEISISTISGNIETQSLDSRSNYGSGNSGNGGEITLNAEQINPPGDGNTGKLKIYTFSLGQTGSKKGGDVNITTNNLSNTDILTLSSNSESGKVTIESQTQEPLQIKDSSIITSEQVTVTLPWGEEIQVKTGDTQSGDVSINSSGDLNLNNVTIESDTKSDEAAGDVNIYSIGTSHSTTPISLASLAPKARPAKSP